MNPKQNPMIKIGKYVLSGKDASVDLAYLMELKLLVQAMTRGGKSHGVRVILEESFPHVQQIIIDGENEYYTLREKFPYLLFGSKEDDNADVQIHTKLSEVLPETLMKLNNSAILDISEFKPHERKLFVRKFFEKLLNIPKKLRHPCLVVLDEAQVYAPEKGYGESEASNAIKDFAVRCGKRKFSLIVCTQRPSALSKDITGACGMKLIGYAGQEQDRKRNAAELGMSTKSQDTMIFSKLGKPHYQFYAFGNGLAEEPTLIKFNKSKTTHSQAGLFIDKKPPATPVKLRTVLSGLQDLPEQAEHELKTIEDYKRKINEFQLKLNASKGQFIQDPNALKKEYEKGFLDGIKDVDEITIQYNNELQSIKERFEKFLNLEIYKIIEKSEKTKKMTLPQIEKTPEISNIQQLKSLQDSFPAGDTMISNNDLNLCATKCLKTLASFNKPLSRTTLAVYSKYRPTSGGYKAAIKDLREYGYITDNGNIEITQLGIQKAGVVEPLPTNHTELINSWTNKLAKCPGVLLQILCSVYPMSLTRDDLAIQTGYRSTSGGFKAGIKLLRELGLATESNGRISATASLFPGEFLNA